MFNGPKDKSKYGLSKFERGTYNAARDKWKIIAYLSIIIATFVAILTVIIWGM